MTRRRMASTSSSSGGGRGTKRAGPSSPSVKTPSGANVWKCTLLRLRALPARWTAVTPPVRGSTAPSLRAALRCQAKTALGKMSSKREARAGWRAARKRTWRRKEHPLAKWHGREDVADQVVGTVFHATGGARGTDRGLAGEGDEPLEATVRTSDSRESSGQDPTRSVSAQVAFHERGQAAAVTAPLAGVREEGLEVLPHDGLEERLLRLPPAVVQRCAGGAVVALPGRRRWPCGSRSPNAWLTGRRHPTWHRKRQAEPAQRRDAVLPDHSRAGPHRPRDGRAVRFSSCRPRQGRIGEESTGAAVLAQPVGPARPHGAIASNGGGAPLSATAPRPARRSAARSARILRCLDGQGRSPIPGVVAAGIPELEHA